MDPGAPRRRPQLPPAFRAIREHVVGACAYCARAYGVKDVIEESDIPLTAEYRDHPSIRTLIVKGYQVVTF